MKKFTVEEARAAGVQSITFCYHRNTGAPLAHTMTIRYRGADGLTFPVRTDYQTAKQITAEVCGADGWKVAYPPNSNCVVFWT